MYLNLSNSDVTKKFTEINRNERYISKFVIILEAVKQNIANKSQFNFESRCALGDIYAIKVDNHRFYTLCCKSGGYREFYICRYGRKQSQENTKKLTTTIESIHKISIQKLLK